ncbi:MAG: SDR family oxidoreductase [Desulfohalobiaceae bacterium]|nr:SDR family oxidoreductase [Desulfohalobiaceae bacterium]
MKFNNSIALITGGGRGIGRTTAMELAKAGARVLIWDVGAEDGEKTANEIDSQGGTAFFSTVDISQVGQIRGAYQEIKNRWGLVDILINAAGICNAQPIESITEEKWDRLFSVNLKGTFFCSQVVMDGMKKQKQGKIVNMGSVAGKLGGIAAGADYAASKAGVMCLTKSFARTLAPYNVQVNAVAPGVIETEMTRQLSGGKWERYLDTIPLGRIGSVLDVAKLIMFLASKDADYITGEIIDINGGQYMD